MNINVIPSKSNFCTAIREAIGALGCSSVMALNAVKSALGEMKMVNGDKLTATTGKVKIRVYKDEDKESKASTSVKTSAVKFESKASTALRFSSFDDTIAEAESLQPTMSIRFTADSEFAMWLKRVATPKPEKKPEEKETEKKP